MLQCSSRVQAPSGSSSQLEAGAPSGPAGSMGAISSAPESCEARLPLGSSLKGSSAGSKPPEPWCRGGISRLPREPRAPSSPPEAAGDCVLDLARQEKVRGGQHQVLKLVRPASVWQGLVDPLCRRARQDCICSSQPG